MVWYHTLVGISDSGFSLGEVAQHWVTANLRMASCKLSCGSTGHVLYM
jgi:hypothetical protein